ncbi:acetylornithine and succinylornithine aminotransferase [Cantharellus anzutake]|uniref:acetylornithine and succinylornithine aminotransferase n=1 Tax=Cantharellus anzutake TaxID=1750568 RepID=UPI0019071BC1|nr:acetylornithine and succinylornithine aminotransferase [Cantharellus anzutake]KAF8331096.1 acetylornithine and succinylornithine aminotransferase [Cantharellus anzutake]
MYRVRTIVHVHPWHSAARLSVRFNSTSSKYTAVTHPEDTSSVPKDISNTLARHSKHVLNTYARPPIILSHGKGSWIYDTSHRKYLDFSSGIAVNALGHGDEQLVKIMNEQASKLIHSSNVFHNEWAGELAELVINLTKRDGGLGWASGTQVSSSSEPTSGAKVFLANSGTEANEGALKFARKVGKDRWAKANGISPADYTNPAYLSSPKTKIVAFDNAFHGRSMGSLSVTSNPKYQAPFAPLIPGVEIGAYNDIEALERLITEDTCGVIVEPVQGEGGVHTASTDFLRALRKRCDAVDAVLIFDEIQCGLYRSGTLWAHSLLPIDCHPDIVTMAKPIANGFPLGAILTRDAIAESMTIGSHGTTFGGSPIAARLAHHVLSRLSDPSFISSVNRSASHLSGRLSRLPTYFPTLLHPYVRGKGLILGLPFKNESHPGVLTKMARERGVLLLTAGQDAVRFVPSLNVNLEEIDFAVDVIESALGVMEKA